MGMYIIIGIIVLLVIYIFITYNSLINTNNIVKEAFSTMDVYLKKRWDLIPNLVEVVKEYAKFEKDAFSEITSLRIKSYESMSVNNKIDVNEQLTQGISKIMAISENYPELKSSENFLRIKS